MTTLRMAAFSGEIPRLLPRLLPDNAAQEARNTRMIDGSLTPTREPRFVHHFDPLPPAGFKTIYRHQGEWLGWEDDVYAVQGPVASERLYIFGDGKPKMRVEGVEYELAVARPTVALTATVTGSATEPGTNVTRLYVYTNVTQFGEESEPSPVSNEADWSPGQSVTLSGFSTTMTNGRTATTQRIYRSQTGQTGTLLYLIAERAASTSDFVDTVPVDAIQEPLPSASYNAPPDGLTGVITLPNGMMAGFMGKDVYFCEPYIPHAWPEKYMLAVDYDIVGLAAYGTSIVVTTKGNPYIMSGSAPENMQAEKLELNLPCINARGIQDLGYSVAYPSHDGLVLVSSGSASVGSGQLLSRDDWQKILPATIVSGQLSGRYFAAYRYADEQNNEYRGTLIFDVTGSQPFILRADMSPDAFYYDITDGLLYFLDGADVYIFDAPGAIAAKQFYKAKEYVLPRPANFGAILVESDSAMSDEQIEAVKEKQAEVLAENQGMIDSGLLGGVLNGAAFGALPVNGDLLKEIPALSSTISVSVYADEKIVANVSKVNRMQRLPSGFLARKWSVSVYGDVRVSQIALATTGAELMEV